MLNMNFSFFPFKTIPNFVNNFLFNDSKNKLEVFYASHLQEPLYFLQKNTEDQLNQQIRTLHRIIFRKKLMKFDYFKLYLHNAINNNKFFPDQIFYFFQQLILIFQQAKVPEIYIHYTQQYFNIPIFKLNPAKARQFFYKIAYYGIVESAGVTPQKFSWNTLLQRLQFYQYFMIENEYVSNINIFKEFINKFSKEHLANQNSYEIFLQKIRTNYQAYNALNLKSSLAKHKDLQSNNSSFNLIASLTNTAKNLKYMIIFSLSKPSHLFLLLNLISSAAASSTNKRSDVPLAAGITNADLYYPGMVVSNNQQLELFYCANGLDGDGYGCQASFFNSTQRLYSLALNNFTANDQRFVSSTSLNGTHTLLAFCSDQIVNFSTKTEHIEVKILDENAGLTSVASLSNTMHINSYNIPSVACLVSSNNCLVVYSSPYTGSIKAQFISKQGNIINSLFTVKNNVLLAIDGNVSRAEVGALNTSQQFVILSEECNTVNGPCGITGTIYNDQGIKQTTFTVATPVNANDCNLFPKFHPLQNDNYLIYWTYFRAACSNINAIGNLQVRLFNNTGVPISNIIHLSNSDGYGMRTATAVSILDKVLFAYDLNVSAPNGFQLYVQLFDPNNLTFSIARSLVNFIGISKRRPTLTLFNASTIAVSWIEQSAPRDVQLAFVDNQLHALNRYQSFNFSEGLPVSLQPVVIQAPPYISNLQVRFVINNPIGFINVTLIEGINSHSNIEMGQLFLEGMISSMNNVLATLRYHPLQNTGNITALMTIMDEAGNQLQGEFKGYGANNINFFSTSSMTSGSFTSTDTTSSTIEDVTTSTTSTTAQPETTSLTTVIGTTSSTTTDNTNFATSVVTSSTSITNENFFTTGQPTTDTGSASASVYFDLVYILAILASIIAAIATAIASAAFFARRHGKENAISLNLELQHQQFERRMPDVSIEGDDNNNSTPSFGLRSQ